MDIFNSYRTVAFEFISVSAAVCSAHVLSYSFNYLMYYDATYTFVILLCFMICPTQLSVNHVIGLPELVDSHSFIAWLANKRTYTEIAEYNGDVRMLTGSPKIAVCAHAQWRSTGLAENSPEGLARRRAAQVAMHRSCSLF